MSNVAELKTQIINEIANAFEAGDDEHTIAFKAGIDAILVTHLEPFIEKLNSAPPQQVATTPQFVASQKKGGRNGYNEFSAELRHKLVQEMGSEEKAKVRWVELGGTTGNHVKEAWHKLSAQEKQVYNDRAKVGRNIPQQMVMTQQGAVAMQIVAPKREKSAWQRFQGAWSRELKARAEAGEEIATYKDIGERTKACSVAYKLVKDKPQELEVYLAKYTA